MNTAKVGVGVAAGILFLVGLGIGYGLRGSESRSGSAKDSAGPFVLVSNGAYSIARMDTRSGQTWVAMGGMPWMAVEEPAKKPANASGRSVAGQRYRDVYNKLLAEGSISPEEYNRLVGNATIPDPTPSSQTPSPSSRSPSFSGPPR